MKIFGERLKYTRLDKDLTQKELAQMLNVTGNTVHSWETDKQEPSMAMILKICKVLDVSIEYLFGETEY